MIVNCAFQIIVYCLAKNIFSFLGVYFLLFYNARRKDKCAMQTFFIVLKHDGAWKLISSSRYRDCSTCHLSGAQRITFLQWH
jgi:hypothetical protein